jgi:hypothetical protein
MFPELANVSNDRVRFSVTVATAKVTIPDSLWPIVVSALPMETIVHVNILELSEGDKQPPSYHTLASSGAGLSGEKDFVLIFSLAGENQAAFVRPGKTFDVRPLHITLTICTLSSDYSNFHSL